MPENYSDYTVSFNYEQRLAEYDIKGSIAHSRMLAKQNIIDDSDNEKIIKGLNNVLSEIRSGKFKWNKDLEDIHMNIEFRLTELIGDTGAKLHTARSRNDQISLDMRMYVKDLNKQAINLLIRLTNTLIKLADENITLILPGYTHLQRAQPILLSHHLLAYSEMFYRDIDRFHHSFERADVMPLGSGALAGLPYNLDRDFVAKQLDFSKISNNSIDAVSDRDFILDYNYSASVAMMHISRLCEELIIWATEEFGFITLSKEFTTWSSIMPQKRNPDFAELARGKTGRVYGNLFALFTILKGLPLAYNRDMQEDKEGFFDTADTINSTLDILESMLDSTQFNEQNMLDAVNNSYILATDIADYLVSKSVPFRKAHEIVSKMTDYCLENNRYFHQLTIDEFKKYSSDFEIDIFEINPINSINNRNTAGGTSESQVKKSIVDIKSRIESFVKKYA